MRRRAPPAALAQYPQEGERRVDKVAFPYRSSSHLALLHVVAESGSWAKHGLEVDYDRQISSSEAHKAVPTGDVEFVSGNHVSTYGHRARGDNWVYLGQTVNLVNTQLVVHPDANIHSIADLREKVVGTRGAHPGLNDWLYLKQRGLDLDRDDVALVNQSRDSKALTDMDLGQFRNEPLWQWIRDKRIDAAFLPPPQSDFARQAGLKVIDVDPLPMIWFTTVSSSLGFAERHPDIVERFLKGLIEGIHFFKTQPDKAIKIIRERYRKEGTLTEQQAKSIYFSLAGILEPKLYPSMQAIANVYEEAIRQDKDAKKVNPMALWDMHAVRRIDDSGFIDRLYGKNV